MIKKLLKSDEHALYTYFEKISADIPFYFPVDFDLWHASMFNDKKNDSSLTEEPLFRELCTDLYYEDSELKGFIQYGITNFGFVNDSLSHQVNEPVIRNMHFERDSKHPGELIEAALKYFSVTGGKEISAFYHFFGMSCYAGHGKLHSSCFYIEDLLQEFMFEKVHENVYFSKDIRQCFL